MPRPILLLTVLILVITGNSAMAQGVFIDRSTDIRERCPQICSRSGLEWTGEWRNLGAGRISCDCSQAQFRGTERACPRIFRPVCAARGAIEETFANECTAIREGYSVLYTGECRVRERFQREPFAACPQINRPVCGLRAGDLRTFANSCEADVAGYDVAYEAPCGTRSLSREPERPRFPQITVSRPPVPRPAFVAPVTENEPPSALAPLEPVQPSVEPASGLAALNAEIRQKEERIEELRRLQQEEEMALEGLRLQRLELQRAAAREPARATVEPETGNTPEASVTTRPLQEAPARNETDAGAADTAQSRERSGPRVILPTPIRPDEEACQGIPRAPVCGGRNGLFQRFGNACLAREAGYDISPMANCGG